MNFRLPLLLVICLSLGLGACSSRKTPATAITGTIGYSTMVDFPDKAQLQLLLLDVSAEGTSPEIATSTSRIKQLPVEYSLPYDAANINPRHRYTISARITVDGVLKYATDSTHEVLTQGKSNHADFAVIAAGSNEVGATHIEVATEIFQGEIRNASDVALYRVGLVDGHINWLEEDRANGTPTPAHNRYEFKGALLVHYRDTSPLEIVFDETGKPKAVKRGDKTSEVAKEMGVINTIRNRASLLRSHALARHASLQHRIETKNDQ